LPAAIGRARAERPERKAWPRSSCRPSSFLPLPMQSCGSRFGSADGRNSGGGWGPGLSRPASNGFGLGTRWLHNMAVPCEPGHRSPHRGHTRRPSRHEQARVHRLRSPCLGTLAACAARQARASTRTSGIHSSACERKCARKKRAPRSALIFRRHRGPRGSAPPVGGATVPSPSPHRRSTGTEPRTPAAASRDSVARRLPRHHPGWATPGIGAPPAHKRDRGIRSWAQGMRRPRDRYVR